jgi:hypothetical protein
MQDGYTAIGSVSEKEANSRKVRKIPQSSGGRALSRRRSKTSAAAGVSQSSWAERGQRWLTRGRKQTVQPRGTKAPPRSLVVKNLEEVPPLLEKLKKEVPRAPWVVVVDGVNDTLTRQIADSLCEAGHPSKLWLVNREGASSLPFSNNGVEFFRLNPNDPRDSQFAANLVADVVVISEGSQESREVRATEWQPRARYVVRDEVAS